MDALMLLALLAGRPDPVAPWQPLIAEAGTRCGISADWIARVMQAESGGRTTQDGHPIRSPKGAIGLMQLMPGTWTEMRATLGLGDNPDDPHDNIVAGACYLRLMYDRFGYPGLFGAYNAGPGRYAAWLAGARPLPSETIAYLRTLGEEAAPAEAAVRPPRPPLFAVHRDANDIASPQSNGEAEADLFAIRKADP